MTMSPITNQKMRYQTLTGYRLYSEGAIQKRYERTIGSLRPKTEPETTENTEEVKTKLESISS